MERLRKKYWGLLIGAGLLLGGLIAPARADSQSAAGVKNDARPRARALGVPFDGQPGPLNTITDVVGVEVGQVTLIRGDGPLRVGTGPVRTGVTAILPTGRHELRPVAAGVAVLNGNGEFTGMHWIKESGMLETPILLTNTHSLGVVRDAVIAWGLVHVPARVHDESFSLPVVAETDDSTLNDMDGFHIKPAHVFAALDGARSGPVAEGNVGGGTGTVTCDFKGGIGTASRQVSVLKHGYIVGALVQTNFGVRSDLHIAGVPVGQLITDLQPIVGPDVAPPHPDGPKRNKVKDGSIIVVLATDAPLLPHQLERLARRATLGLGRLGAIAYDSSGDLFLAFTTARPKVDAEWMQTWTSLPNDALDYLFEGAVQATEEAIVNALVAAKTMVGIDGHTVYALPHERLRRLMQQYGRAPSLKPQ